MPSLNTFNVANWIALEGLEMLTNELNVAPYFTTEYNSEYDKEYAIGPTLTIPLTQRYITQRQNTAYNPQALDRPVTTVNIDQTSTVAIDYEAIEEALNMERGEENIRKLYIKPAVDYIRQDIESYCAQFAYQHANMLVGALGTNPTTIDGTSAAARQALVEMSCEPNNDTGIIVPPVVTRAVKGSAVGFFAPQTDISKQYRTGMLGTLDSLDWLESMSLFRHTAGTWANVALLTVNGNGQSGSTLNINCTTNDTFNAGDHFSIASVNQVNQMTRTVTSTSTTGSKVFVVTANTSGASSTAALSIYPPIFGPGSQFQNVDALPVGGALLTMWPGTNSPSAKTGRIGLVLNPRAFALCSVKLTLPTAVDEKAQFRDPKTGVAIRFIRQWDNVNNRMTNRLDCTWGCGALLAEQAAVSIACA